MDEQEVTYADPEHRTKTTNEKRMLKVLLTQDELIQAGQNLADQLRQKAKIEAELAAISKQMKAKVAEVEAQIEQTRGLVHDRYEMRWVPCQNILDYTDVKAYTFRLDTGEQIEDRKLTEDEKQSTLPFDDEPEDEETLADAVEHTDIPDGDGFEV